MDNQQLAVLREIVCPDGTTYIVNEDGTWEHQSWDGHFVRDSAEASTTPSEVLEKIGEDQYALTEEQKADGVLAYVVAPDGTQFWVYEDGSYVRECWDGSYVGDNSDTGPLTAAILAKFAA